ncbi:hypothetical protein FHS24_001577 [Psychrobacter luti]|uniref:Uncharacterized protein n=1 Tax=Psychrobacter luti TaxID=198481 RepID=A0A839TDD4_9GAMM|nr:hypothetical protein [Psychrobacter luti]MBB3107060.1 hypothetical protein [Psychrobacter luti]
MSQIFHLCLATDTLAADAQTLGVTIEDLQSIQVEVIVTLAQTNQIAQTAQITQSAQQPEWHLQLDYRVTMPLKSLAAQLDWSKWQPTQVGFKDYLWEQTCLECFLAGRLITDRLINDSASINDVNELGIDGVDANKTSAYIEINANPDGRYALYHFRSYRNPVTLPPMPLLQPDGQTQAFINWTASHYPGSNGIANNGTANTEQNSLSAQIEPAIDSLTPKTSTANPYVYQRSFTVPLSQLSNAKIDMDDTAIDYIHPCVILSFGTTFGTRLDTMALYFAPKHASPPDFHNLQYWSVFDKQTALAK